MDKRKAYVGIAAAMGMLVLILDSRTALEGAQNGIELCIRTVIPSLFPFFLLSILLNTSLSGTQIPFLRPIAGLCGMPRGSESILICAFLGGYPVGAQAVADCWRRGQLSRQDAERMLGFCSNAGPSFMFGMVGAMFPEKQAAWMLWGIHISSAIVTAAVLPGKSLQTVKLPSGNPVSPSAALRSALSVMGQVCGWVVLFRVWITFLQRWMLWLLPLPVQVIVTGLLELANGCCDLWQISDASLRMLSASMILAFGGLCVAMQTISVTAGLSLRYYYAGKLMQTVFSLLLCSMLLFDIWLPGFGLLAVLTVSLRKMQIGGSNRAAVGV